MEGVRVDGELLKDVKFADYQEMVAHTEKGLHTLMDALSKTVKEYNMKNNVKKHKVMRICRWGNDRRTMIRSGESVNLSGITKLLSGISFKPKCLSYTI